VVGFEEHLELNAIEVFKCQDRAIFAFDDRSVMHAELLEPRQPLIEVSPRVDFEAHVIEPGAAGIEGFTLIAVVLLKLENGPRPRMHEQNSVPPIAGGWRSVGVCAV
jgi:hypothetical protein